VMAGPPVSLPPELWECELGEHKTVRLYALLPLFEDEMRFKLERGSESLFEKLDQRGVGELIDVKRRSVLAKRFWVV